ncbi:unnamed protein product [Staurois parvus]|uniref:SOSS complex subunit C n=1 Tax=Staurois parvus TaxID=386267 RepID=A0ABN9B1J0_9NEOB|nr:unnamed protein product [Staurois parvus]
MQNQSRTKSQGAGIVLSRPNVNKDFCDHAEQQHTAVQQKAALQMEVMDSVPTQKLKLRRGPLPKTFNLLAATTGVTGSTVYGGGALSLREDSNSRGSKVQ